MNNLEVKFEAQGGDETQILEYVLVKRQNFGSPAYLWLTGILSLGGLGWFSYHALAAGMKLLSLLLILLALAVVLGLLILFPWLSEKISLLIQLALRKIFPYQPPKADVRIYYITPTGLAGRSIFGDCEIKWEEIGKLDVTEDFLFIHSPVFGIHYIPLRAFAAQEDREAFIAKLKEHL